LLPTKLLKCINKSVKKARVTQIIPLNKRKKYSKLLQKIIIFLLFSLGTLLLILFGDYLLSNSFDTACNSTITDYISCGEEILSPYSRDIYRQQAAKDLREKQYREAWQDLQISWQKRPEAETLIYLNNTLLKLLDADYYTLAVAVPLSYEGITSQHHELAQDFLRGVAQAQTQVNLNLLNSQANSQAKTEYKLPGQQFLTHENITKATKPKGLKIVIIDDRNNPTHTEKIAKKIGGRKEILGVIGHYASEMSLAAVEKYEKSNLTQISFASTAEHLSKVSKPNFFRVVYSNREQAAAVIRSINELDISDKRVAIFYNPNSFYSSDFFQGIKQKIEQDNHDKSSTKEKITIVKSFDMADDSNFNLDLALQEAKKLSANVFILLPDGQISNALANSIKLIEKDNGVTPIVGGNPLINPKVEAIQTSNPPNLTVTTFWHYLVEPKSQFVRESKQLWNLTKIHPGTGMAYDATIVFIEALRQQDKPTRQETLNTIAAPGFSVTGATGEITFNRPQNGDRLNFPGVRLKLIGCGKYNAFVPISHNNQTTKNLACNQ
jgi:ABC-type branched-subunit amino acid transport system substrate-binding protein